MFFTKLDFSRNNFFHSRHTIDQFISTSRMNYSQNPYFKLFCRLYLLYYINCLYICVFYSYGCKALASFSMVLFEITTKQTDLNEVSIYPRLSTYVEPGYDLIIETYRVFVSILKFVTRLIWPKIEVFRILSLTNSLPERQLRRVRAQLSQCKLVSYIFH